MEPDISFDKTVDKIYKVICATCKIKTRHKVLKSVSSSGCEPMTHDPSEEFNWEHIYEIIQCQGCEELSFRRDLSNSEMQTDEDGYYHEVSIYPEQTLDTLVLKNYSNLPSNLERIYKETINCINSENLTLCAAGIRALVESLCLENGIIATETETTLEDGTIKKLRENYSLYDKINTLSTRRILTQQNAEILHHHRVLGNSAVHELTLPHKTELKLAIEILEDVFNSLYEMPFKAQKLARVRSTKAS